MRASHLRAPGRVAFLAVWECSADVRQRGVRIPVNSEVADGHHADDRFVVHDRKPPERLLPYELDGVIDQVFPRYGRKVSAADLAKHRVLRILARGQPTHHEIPVGDDAAGLTFLQHHDVSDVVVSHRARCGRYRRTRGERGGVRGHDLLDSLSHGNLLLHCAPGRTSRNLRSSFRFTQRRGGGNPIRDCDFADAQSMEGPAPSAGEPLEGYPWVVAHHDLLAHRWSVLALTDAKLSRRCQTVSISLEERNRWPARVEEERGVQHHSGCMRCGEPL